MAERSSWYRWDVVVPAAALLLMVAFAIVVPFFSPDPDATSLRSTLLPVLSPGHPLGTDALGRDMLARTAHGARVSLFVGLVSVMLCALIGGFLGMIAGYAGGKIDSVIMRIMDVFMAFPGLILALAIAAYLGPSVRNVIIAITVSRIPAFARLARANTLSVREREFVGASRIMGSSTIRTLVRHVGPNLLKPMATYGFLAVALAMIVEASLSFLGLGVRPPQATWGNMISEGRAELETAPHVVLVPGVALFVTILALNVLSDAWSERAFRSERP